MGDISDCDQPQPEGYRVRILNENNNFNWIVYDHGDIGHVWISFCVDI